jgi:excisionase family DNA binding protein
MFRAEPHRVRDLALTDRRNGEKPASPLGTLLRPSEVARMLGVSRSWLYEAAKDRRIPCVRLGGNDGPLRFVEADLVAWLERARAGWLPGESGAQTLRRAQQP